MTTRLTIRKWLATKNHLPRIVDVEVIERTLKAVHVKGHAAVERPVNCCICGRDLTHPVSQQVGIGPVCADKWGFDWSADTSPEAIAEFKAQLLIDTEFETWLPLSQIECEDNLEDAPRKAAREEQEKPDSVGSLIGAEGRMATLDITPWIAEQKGFQKTTTQVRGKIKRATEKAVLILVGYSYRPVTQDDRNSIARGVLTAEDLKDMGVTIDGDVLRHSYPKRKDMEKWIPVSQITDADIDAPRKPVVRKATIKHEEVAPVERQPTEYSEMCDAALAELGF